MFVGHTRFSLFSPSSGGWRATNGSRFRSVDDYRDYLFSDERLLPRMEIFLGMSLPQLDAASQGYDVHHIVSYPASLPQKFKQELQDAAARYSFLALDEHGPQRGAGGPRQLASDLYRSSGEPFGLYRLDDDDLLPADYFAQVAPYIHSDNAGMVVSLGAGAMALYSGGKYYNLRSTHVPMIAIGLLNICRFDADGTLIEPVRSAHNQADRANPVILDSRRPGFLWTRHVTQDSSLGVGMPDRPDLTDVLLGYMDKHPAATPEDGFEAAFPAAAGAFTGQRHPHATLSQGHHLDIAVGDTPTDLPVASLRGTFSLTLDLRSRNGVGKNHLLLSFTVTTGEGQPLDPASDRDWLAQSGLMVSNNPAIGYFCYVSVRSGTHRIHRSVSLPEGLTVESVSARRFASSTTDITLRSVTVEEHPALDP